VKPGERLNPHGRKTAGATIREWINALAEADLTAAELLKVARDPSVGWTKRAAAERILRTLEAGDISDFTDLLNGKVDLKALRKKGVNTEVLKQFKQKTRRVPVGNGKSEEIIDREIEMHDRAGPEFDRIVEHTDGTAIRRQNIVNHTHITVDSAQAQIDAILARRLGEPRSN
jgi:hypothetical protein